MNESLRFSGFDVESLKRIFDGQHECESMFSIINDHRVSMEFSEIDVDVKTKTTNNTIVN